MSEALSVLVIVLAAWRITILIHADKIMSWFRRLLGETTDEHGFISYPDTFFGNLISCVRCVSVWVGLFVFIAYLVFPYILVPFAISGAIIFIQERLLIRV